MYVLRVYNIYLCISALMAAQKPLQKAELVCGQLILSVCLWKHKPLLYLHRHSYRIRSLKILNAKVNNILVMLFVNKNGKFLKGRLLQNGSCAAPWQCSVSWAVGQCVSMLSNLGPLLTWASEIAVSALPINIFSFFPSLFWTPLVTVLQ